MFIIESRPASLSAPPVTYRISTAGIEIDVFIGPAQETPHYDRLETGFAQVAQRYLSIIVTFRDSEPPCPLRNWVVGRVLLTHCLLPHRLCYGGIKHKRGWG